MISAKEARDLCRSVIKSEESEKKLQELDTLISEAASQGKGDIRVPNVGFNGFVMRTLDDLGYNLDFFDVTTVLISW